MFGVALLLVTFGAVATADEKWHKLTLYDVLREDCRHGLTNKDLGDPAGDAYFMLKDMYLPVACPACQKSSTGCFSPSEFDCGNPESTGNRVVRKIEVEVKKPYGSYELCNEDSDRQCKYECFALTPVPIPGVGEEAICGGNLINCDMAPKPGLFHKKWDFWNYNTAIQLGEIAGKPGDMVSNVTTGHGHWYSFEEEDEEKHWRNATVIKTINSQCHWSWLTLHVETMGKDCFDACPGTTGTNTTSECYVDCFFDTVLGEDSDKMVKPEGGIPVPVILKSWLAGFESDDPDVGGCPPCPEEGACPPPKWMSSLRR